MESFGKNVRHKVQYQKNCHDKKWNIFERILWQKPIWKNCCGKKWNIFWRILLVFFSVNYWQIWTVKPLYKLLKAFFMIKTNLRKIVMANVQHVTTHQESHHAPSEVFGGVAKLWVMGRRAGGDDLYVRSVYRIEYISDSFKSIYCSFHIFNCWQLFRTSGIEYVPSLCARYTV